MLAILIAPILFAQYPKYFPYNDETGLPNNEVYSIVQDKKGFIWIGCDAGLYKFDGIQYLLHKNNSQKSRSVTGLMFSSSGTMYCYNFQSQLFYLEKDTLKELKHPFRNIINTVSDKKGNIYISHLEGISRYNEKRKEWKDYFNSTPKVGHNSSQWAAKSIQGSMRSNILFINGEGIGQILDDSIKKINTTHLFQSSSLGMFESEYTNNTFWVLEKEKGTIYTYSGNNLKKVTNTPLNQLLTGKKITNIKALPDGNLWICTYKGVICFNPKNNSARLLYPDLSFSDCIIDREGNYWFSTLQTGLLRVPDLDFIVWATHNKLTRITADNNHIYFATVNGTIGRLNTLTNKLQTFNTGNDADIQSFDFDFSENTLWFNLNNRLFGLKGNNILKKENHIPAIKALQKVNNDVFTASSQGIFINDEKVNNSWGREIKYNATAQEVWIATNSGLQKFGTSHNKWALHKTFFNDIQIISIDFDSISKQVFAVSAEGEIYSLKGNSQPVLLGLLPPGVQANRIKYYQNYVYTATNKSIYSHSTLEKKNVPEPNNLSALTVGNIQDISITNNRIWLATARGLLQIPLANLSSPKPLAIVYLKNNFIDSLPIQLKYKQPLVLHPEVSAYNSNGNFQYKYRINNTDNNWITLPATIENITIPNLPSGNLKIELKAVDYLGRESENTIVLNGYVHPPFWKTGWFITGALLSIFLLIFFILKKRISNIRKQEQERVQLVNSQLTALKAQMNPHFMYNTLNSIQALILKNDIKNSNLYLNKFSHLMRKVLDASGKEKISLTEEVEILSLYLSLEKLRFGNDFTYLIDIVPEIETDTTFLPPLILQPFIENAIKHGLLHKKGEKNLLIRLEKNTVGLICRIKDNGIGRKHSEEIKKRQQSKHHSFSTDATKKRLELLNRTNNQKITLFINDLYANNQAVGTEVIVEIK